MSDDGPTVYEMAREEWNRVYGVHVRHARQWRQAALWCCGIALASVVGLVTMASQPRQVPYIVEVDRTAAPIRVVTAERLDQASPTLIRAALATWVREWRTVSIDREMQMAAVERVFVYLPSAGQSREALSRWYTENSPFERAREGTVTVDVRQPLSISAASWRLEWTEQERNRSGGLVREQDMAATLTVAIRPATGETVLVNPMGLYIVQVDWSEQL